MTEEEKILYGFGETRNIVSIQQISSKEMRLYIREKEKINFIDRRFYPFFFVSDEKLLPSFEGKYWKKRLIGNEFYNYIFAFENWSDMIKALKQISRTLNRPFNPKIKMDEIYIHYEPITQFLLQSGETLFKGMKYEDLKILYVKILAVIENKSEIHSKHFDQIFAIALSDNEDWKKVLFQKPKAVKERDLLLQFLEIIEDKDPDLIVGFNLYDELAYLNSRFETYNLSFSIGRDKSEPLIDVENKIKVGEKRVPLVLISGRHLVDLLQILSHSRTILREIDDYSLKSISKYFGINYPEDASIDDSKIPFYADHQPQKLCTKVEVENEIILKLSNHILPQNFYQAQFLPMDFSQVINTGVSSKIELLMVREYLRKRHSLPKAKSRTQISGGYTDVFYSGLFDNIIYADVESLYPSIIIHNKIYPSSDKLKVFLKLVTILTKERLRLKRMKEEIGDPYLKMHYDTMQNSYKILINSFYGYLGFSEGIFNDFEKANEVTIKGQQILKQLINEFQKRNCIVIEVDTDGLYVSPQKELSEEEERKLVEEVNSLIPTEINLSFGGRFKRMLSYKKKNYALLTYDNKLIIKGSALISKSFENFALNFLRECIELIITDKIEQIPKIYLALKEDIQKLKVNINDLAKTEILKDTYKDYIEAVKNGRRLRSAAYELAYKYYGDKCQPGMKITYYITGNDPNVKVFENCELVEFYNPNFPNVNIPYYLKKLDEYISRFSIFFSEKDFELLFPKEGTLIFSIKPKVINSLVRD